jgi:3-phenylpropionate/cinnamic acid dioxygenase small subunit
MTTSASTSREPGLDPARKGACISFLYREAELLDRRQFEQWLGLLHPDLQYEIPVRVTVGSEDLDTEFTSRGVHTRDSYRSMEMRVRRLQTEHAFAENPPSRTTRLVTNVQAHPLGETEIDVWSKFLLYRSQGSATTHDLLAGDRHDVLTGIDGELKLAKRTVYLAHTTIPTMNLGVFL